MPESTPDATQAVRLAIEILTSNLSAQTPRERVDAVDYITRRFSGPDAPDPIHVLYGQLYLNEVLLLSLAKLHGRQPEDYRTWAMTWLSAQSSRLPN